MAAYASTVIAIAQTQVGYLEKETNANLDSKTGNAGDENFTKYARDFDYIIFTFKFKNSCNDILASINTSKISHFS